MADVLAWNIKRILLASALLDDYRPTVRQGVALLQLVEVRFSFPDFFFHGLKDLPLCSKPQENRKRNSAKTIGRTRHKQAYTHLGSFTHFSRTQTYSIADVLLRLVSAMFLVFENPPEKEWRELHQVGRYILTIKSSGDASYMVELPAARFTLLPTDTITCIPYQFPS